VTLQTNKEIKQESNAKQSRNTSHMHKYGTLNVNWFQQGQMVAHRGSNQEIPW